jgi:pimeloyl-ACP methyl ester carboxylesterase
VIVVGYSMDGPVGLLLARPHPGTVAALVMQATALEARGTAREWLAWRPLLAAFEMSLRLGTGAGVADRVARQAVEEEPGPGRYRPWPAPELRRGLPARARRRSTCGEPL